MIFSVITAAGQRMRLSLQLMLRFKRAITRKLAILTVFVPILWTTPAISQPGTTAQAIIRGQVTNGKLEVLSGVSIAVKGTTTGTTSDGQGRFAINAPINATLLFSFVGYTSQEVAVGVRTTLNVVLQEKMKHWAMWW